MLCVWILFKLLRENIVEYCIVIVSSVLRKQDIVTGYIGNPEKECEKNDWIRANIFFLACDINNNVGAKIYRNGGK